jgi:MoxR-like ATPase
MVEVADPTEARALVAEAEALAERLARVRQSVGRVIFGQETVVSRTLITLLSGGHVLLVGVPGLGKTKLVDTLGTVLGLDAKRVQFTPDLMPSDILGSEVLEEDMRGAGIPLHQGPGLLPAADGGRDQPREPPHPVGAAAGDAGAQGRDRRRGASPARPFHVLATQNPIEQEGTYPLPEAQLDRFLLEIDVSYPDLAAERAMLLATTGASERSRSRR